jgi:putative membrane protein
LNGGPNRRLNPSKEHNMTGALSLAWLHYLAMMFLAAALVAEHLMFTPRPDPAAARKLVAVDLIYGVSLLVVLLTGIGRLFHGGKGIAFYMANGAYHAKFTLFVVMALVWLYPALKFLAWRRALRVGQTPALENAEARRVLMAIRLQLLILVLLPLLAAMMARGVWS